MLCECESNSLVRHRLHHPLFPFSENLFLLLFVGRRLGQRDVQIRSGEIRLVQSVHGCFCHLAIFEVYKCIVLDLLDALHLAVGFEDLAEFVFRDGSG